MLGELAALSSAILWAVAVEIFSHHREAVPAVVTNLFKCGVAALLFLVVNLINATGVHIFSPEVGILVVSGFLGIGLGDTAFMSSLRYLDPTDALLLFMMAPVFASLFAFFTIGETLTLTQCTGIGIVLFGVCVAIYSKRSHVSAHAPLARKGVLLALTAAAAQGAGAVMSRYALTSSPLTPPMTSLIRLLSGLVTILLLIWIGVFKVRFEKKLQQPRLVFSHLLLATFLGTFVGIWCQQFALSRTSAGIAQTLSSTSPVFSSLIGIFRGRRVQLKFIVATAIVFLGIWLLLRAK